MSDGATVFSLFYAISFGGTLTRLGEWSAFWKDSPAESSLTCLRRVFLTYLVVHALPAAYFGWGVWLLGEAHIPTRYPGSSYGRLL